MHRNMVSQIGLDRFPSHSSLKVFLSTKSYSLPLSYELKRNKPKCLQTNKKNNSFGFVVSSKMELVLGEYAKDLDPHIVIALRSMKSQPPLHPIKVGVVDILNPTLTDIAFQQYSGKSYFT